MATYSYWPPGIFRWLQGGTVNVEAAARTVLTDWNDGRIPYFTEPPQRSADDHAGASIVASWGAEFQADEVLPDPRLTIPAVPSVLFLVSCDVPAVFHVHKHCTPAEQHSAAELA